MKILGRRQRKLNDTWWDSTKEVLQVDLVTSRQGIVAKMVAALVAKSDGTQPVLMRVGVRVSPSPDGKASQPSTTEDSERSL